MNTMLIPDTANNVTHPPSTVVAEVSILHAANVLDLMRGSPFLLLPVIALFAGLPFAIAALFLAEPSGAPKQLLPYGLQQLLSIASDESLQEPWPRVRLHYC